MKRQSVYLEDIESLYPYKSNNIMSTTWEERESLKTKRVVLGKAGKISGEPNTAQEKLSI